MAPIIVIKSIKKKHVLSNDDYLWVLEHRNKPLKLCGIWYTRDGDVDYIVIYKDSESIVTLFKENNVEWKVYYDDANTCNMQGMPGRSIN